MSDDQKPMSRQMRYYYRNVEKKAKLNAAYWKKNKDKLKGKYKKKKYILTDEQKAAASLKAKEYYQKNKEILKHKRKPASAATKKKAAERAAIKYAENTLEIREKQKQYAKSNPDKIKAKKERYRKSPSGMAASVRRRLKAKDRDSIVAKEWRAKNPEKCRSYHSNRRSLKANAEGSHTGDDIINLFETQNGFCAACKTCIAGGFHVDHVIPLSRGGSNWPSNLQLLCKTCNLRKHDLMPDEFINKMKILSEFFSS